MIHICLLILTVIGLHMVNAALSYLEHDIICFSDNVKKQKFELIFECRLCCVEVTQKIIL